jgi:type IV/VI secretion system ImpK/VasF family protein
MASLLRAAGDLVTLIELIGNAPDASLGQPSDLRNQLKSQLERFTRAAASSTPPPDGAALEEARFALIAWTDEVILRSRWSGRHEWEKHTLGMELLRTANAGQEFFQHLEKLPRESRAREVFFAVLALGFEGQYIRNEAERAQLIQREFETLRAIGATVELGRERDLTPAAYKVQVDRGGARGSGVLRYVLTLLAVALLAYGAGWALLQLLVTDLPPVGGG